MKKFLLTAIVILSSMSILSAEVSVEISGSAISITNNTNQNWRLGGARFTPIVANSWTSVDNYAREHITINNDASPMVDIYFRSTAPSDEAAGLRAGGTRHINHSFGGDQAGRLPRPDTEIQLLLRTGAPGVPDNPISAEPITISGLIELINHPDFHNPNFRHSSYDSLGSNGGKFSAGFMNTYAGKTQIHFAIPRGNTIRGAAAIKGHEAPEYYMALAMGQELFNADAQFMFAVGAIESRSGTTLSHMISPSNPTNGSYSSWQFEGISMLDRTLNYPQFFPKYETQLAAAPSTGHLYTGNFEREFFGHYVGGYYNGQTSPYTINGLLMSALFHYANYDILAHSTDICWKYALENAADPYMGLSAMLAAYNVGLWGQIGSIRNIMNTQNVDNLINDPNARDLFHPGATGNYCHNVLNVAQALIDASRDFTLGNGENSEVIDFEITLEQLRAMFFGTGGTAFQQGDGGVLLHFYDPSADRDVSVVRQRIWDNLTQAFNILKNKAPTSSENTISFRYDFLSAIRAVKADLPFNRRFNISGDAATLIPNNSSPVGCVRETGGEADEVYPHARVGIIAYEDVCSVLVGMSDNVKNGKVQWTIDNSWAIWHTAEMVESEAARENSFRFAIPRNLAEALDQRYVWIMAEDAHGNSVVLKREIRFSNEPGEPKEVSVIFDYGQGFVIQRLTMTQSLLSKPAETPVRTGYALDGWFRNENLTNPWNFESDIVRGTMTLYAKWIPVFPLPELRINGKLTDVQILDANNRIMTIEFDASQMPAEFSAAAYTLKYRLKFQERITIDGETGQFTIPAGSKDKLSFVVNLTNFLEIGNALGEDVLQATIVIENERGESVIDTIIIGIGLKEPIPLSIFDTKGGQKFGIAFAKNPTEEIAEMIVSIPENSQVSLVIYDKTGNILNMQRFRTDRDGNAKAEWDLTNRNGRKVASGIYVVLIEAEGVSGRYYRYSAKLGVRK